MKVIGKKLENRVPHRNQNNHNKELELALTDSNSGSYKESGIAGSFPGTGGLEPVAMSTSAFKISQAKLGTGS